MSNDPQSVIPSSKKDHDDLFQLANEVRERTKQITARGDLVSAAAMGAIRMGEKACIAAQALLTRREKPRRE